MGNYKSIHIQNIKYFFWSIIGYVTVKISYNNLDGYVASATFIFVKLWKSNFTKHDLNIFNIPLFFKMIKLLKVSNGGKNNCSYTAPPQDVPLILMRHMAL